MLFKLSVVVLNVIILSVVATFIEVTFSAGLLEQEKVVIDLKRQHESWACTINIYKCYNRK